MKFGGPRLEPLTFWVLPAKSSVAARGLSAYGVLRPSSVRMPRHPASK